MLIRLELPNDAGHILVNPDDVALVEDCRDGAMIYFANLDGVRRVVKGTASGVAEQLTRHEK